MRGNPSFHMRAGQAIVIQHSNEKKDKMQVVVHKAMDGSARTEIDFSGQWNTCMRKLNLLATCSLMGLYCFDLVITYELREYNSRCVLLMDINLLFCH